MGLSTQSDGQSHMGVTHAVALVSVCGSQGCAPVNMSEWLPYQHGKWLQITLDRGSGWKGRPSPLHQVVSFVLNMLASPASLHVGEIESKQNSSLFSQVGAGGGGASIQSPLSLPQSSAGNREERLANPIIYSSIQALSSGREMRQRKRCQVRNVCIRYD